ncbi:hypothetical protein BCR37DRAFT_382283 [Protomyces lactucae-debilis]|uniref:Uncharacterized protein n=1 Tax=Protomyces lactucae-debilis TaxID=2754530 RepID=A0A1Y2F569_PROLT|nr:uncharacterized protein BCR37DRAFT_382283 [Protomyces lactucae-debilis]ORY78634.1 hypothetical protein BCR37DRAFT_382283 [Protomyces lactucae-debilis]
MSSAMYDTLTMPSAMYDTLATTPDLTTLPSIFNYTPNRPPTPFPFYAPICFEMSSILPRPTSAPAQARKSRSASISSAFFTSRSQLSTPDTPVEPPVVQEPMPVPLPHARPSVRFLESAAARPVAPPPAEDFLTLLEKAARNSVVYKKHEESLKRHGFFAREPRHRSPTRLTQKDGTQRPPSPFPFANAAQALAEPIPPLSLDAQAKPGRMGLGINLCFGFGVETPRRYQTFEEEEDTFFNFFKDTHDCVEEPRWPGEPKRLAKPYIFVSSIFDNVPLPVVRKRLTGTASDYPIQGELYDFVAKGTESDEGSWDMLEDESPERDPATLPRLGCDLDAGWVEVSNSLPDLK